MLIDLTEQFAKAFAEKKRSKNILDYADLEHFALEILVQQKDGCLVRTDAARELSEQFREIMIDEYQDSNLSRRHCSLRCPVRRTAGGTGLWSAISSRVSTDFVWRGRSCFWKNIARIKKTEKASRGLISIKTFEAGRRCLQGRTMCSVSS